MFNREKLERLNIEAMENLEDMVNQHCTIEHPKYGTVLCTQCLSSNESALFFLFEQGRVEDVTGKQTLYRWKKKGNSQ